MIGVVIPAHNEAERLPLCLESVRIAVTRLNAMHEVRVVVVLDACTDASEHIARAYGVDLLHVDACSVGAARHAGAAYALAMGAKWLSFTDADSAVPNDWLVTHLSLEADAVCGLVVVDDWDGFAPGVKERYQVNYQNCDGHRHIHGANLGVSAQAYSAAGGFRPLPNDEDVTLVADLVRTGAQIAWTARGQVHTSARRQGRAPGGFAGFLDELSRRAAELATPVKMPAISGIS